MPGSARIALLLEDEPLIAMDMEQILAEAGFAVTTLDTCEEAERWLTVCVPDIAVVDVELRDGRCLEVVERLIKSDVPFIVHSGDHPGMHVGTPFAHGRWISKPAGPKEMVGAARALLSA